MEKVEILKTKRKVLKKNEEIASENKQFLEKHGIKAIEFLGGPGSGKTYLIRELVKEIQDKYNIAYVGGDLAGKHDAELIGETGIPALQINTGNMCHLEAFHLQDALEKLSLSEKTNLLIIENVGNLICPFQLKLGSHKRIVLVDPSEGVEKFEKYPVAFLNSDIIVISKVDLAPALDVNPEVMVKKGKKANPNAKIVQTSAKTKKGINKLAKILET